MSKAKVKNKTTHQTDFFTPGSTPSQKEKDLAKLKRILEAQRDYNTTLARECLEAEKKGDYETLLSVTLSLVYSGENPLPLKTEMISVLQQNPTVVRGATFNPLMDEAKSYQMRLNTLSNSQQSNIDKLYCHLHEAITLREENFKEYYVLQASKGLKNYTTLSKKQIQNIITQEQKSRTCEMAIEIEPLKTCLKLIEPHITTELSIYIKDNIVSVDSGKLLVNAGEVCNDIQKRINELQTQVKTCLIASHLLAPNTETREQSKALTKRCTALVTNTNKKIEELLLTLKKTPLLENPSFTIFETLKSLYTEYMALTIQCGQSLRDTLKHHEKQKQTDSKTQEKTKKLEEESTSPPKKNKKETITSPQNQPQVPTTQYPELAATFAKHRTTFEQMFENPTPHYQMTFKELIQLVERAGGSIKPVRRGSSHHTIKLGNIYADVLNSSTFTAPKPHGKQHNKGTVPRYVVNLFKRAFERADITPQTLWPRLTNEPKC